MRRKPTSPKSSFLACFWTLMLPFNYSAQWLPFRKYAGKEASIDAPELNMMKAEHFKPDLHFRSCLNWTCDSLLFTTVTSQSQLYTISIEEMVNELIWHLEPYTCQNCASFHLFPSQGLGLLLFSSLDSLPPVPAPGECPIKHSWRSKDVLLTIWH